MDTQRAEYAHRLQRLEGRRLARWFDVQRPYRWNLRRLEPGFTLDVGCGIGRNLRHLDGRGVGIDHNAEAVAIACEAGLVAFTPDDFTRSSYSVNGSFDSLLCSHVVEHMGTKDAHHLIAAHLRFVKPGGRVIVICPQEAGYKSDDTHVQFHTSVTLTELLEACDIEIEASHSFPFPTTVGRVFRYNETVMVGRVRRSTTRAA